MSVPTNWKDMSPDQVDTEAAKQTGTQVAATAYDIVDRHTGQVISASPYSNAKRARARVDKLDNIYGAYRYYARPIETPDPQEVIQQIEPDK